MERRNNTYLEIESSSTQRRDYNAIHKKGDTIWKLMGRQAHPLKYFEIKYQTLVSADVEYRTSFTREESYLLKERVFVLNLEAISKSLEMKRKHFVGKYSWFENWCLFFKTSPVEKFFDKNGLGKYKEMMRLAKNCLCVSLTEKSKIIFNN